MPDKKQFPISYISHCLSPRAMFASRAQFTWWQNLLIIVFLNALIMIPVTLHYANMTTYPLERIVTKSLSPITDKTYQALTQGKIEKDTFQGQSLIRRDGELVLAVLPTKVDLEQLASESTRQIIVTKKNGVLLPLMARNSVLTLEASSSHSLT
ncbi:maltodextrose utilization protein malA [Streptococcus pyogenes]|nr:maltodextrose utilization protein malA [Streptococcus pyogenes]